MKCKECPNDFEPSNGQGGFEKIFCSALCKSRFNSRVRYNNKKDDPAEKSKKSEYYKKWYEKNKESHNLKMKMYMRTYKNESKE